MPDPDEVIGGYRWTFDPNATDQPDAEDDLDETIMAEDPDDHPDRVTTAEEVLARVRAAATQEVMGEPAPARPRTEAYEIPTIEIDHDIDPNPQEADMADERTTILRGITEEQLQEAGYKAYDKLRDQRGEGFAVSKRTMQRILSRFDLKVVGESASEYEGLTDVFVAQFHQKVSKGKYNAYLKDWNGADHEPYMQVVAEFAERIKRNINVFVPHGMHTPLPKVKKDELNIFVWSSPSGESERDTLKTKELWGHKLGCNDALRPKPIGTTIKAPEGIEVAEQYYNSLYIWFDAVHNTGDDAVNIFREILLASEAAMAIELEKTEEDRQADAFIRICTERSSKAIDIAKKNLAEKTKVIEGCKKELIEASRDAKHLQIFIENSKDQKLSEDNFRKEFKRILARPYVTDFHITPEQVKFHTKRIVCTEPKTKEKYDLGEFDITLRLSHGDVVYKSYKEFGGHPGMQAPHVFERGNPCLGNMDRALPELIASYEVGAAMDMTVAFLQTSNISDSAGYKTYKWPLVGETKAEWEKRQKFLEAGIGRGQDPYKMKREKV